MVVAIKRSRKKSEIERRVINIARLLHRDWANGLDGRDGGKAMRVQLYQLGNALALLDATSMNNGGWGPPKPCRWCGEMRPTLKNGSFRWSPYPCKKNPEGGDGWASCEA